MEQEEDRETVVAEPYESLVPREENEKPELEIDEEELVREWVEAEEMEEIADIGEMDRGGQSGTEMQMVGTWGNWLVVGVIHVGSRISSESIAKSSSSS